jgi:hypothetical protein
VCTLASAKESLCTRVETRVSEAKDGMETSWVEMLDSAYLQYEYWYRENMGLGIEEEAE